MARPKPGSAASARSAGHAGHVDHASAGVITQRPSPLHALDALDRSLARERWFFSTLVGLLVLVILCATIFAISSLSSSALLRDGERLRALNAQTNRILTERYTLLTGVRLLLSLDDEGQQASGTSSATGAASTSGVAGATGPANAANPPDAAPPVCTPAFSGLPANDGLRRTCDAAVRDFQAVSSALPLLLVRADGSAAYEYHPGYRPDAPSPQPPLALPSGNTAWLLVVAASEQINARSSAAMHVAHGGARGSDVVWFHPPAGLGLSLGLDPHQMLGVSVALKNGKPYVLAFTSVNPADWVNEAAASAHDAHVSAPTLVGAEGAALAGPLTGAGVRALERRIATLPVGRFHRVQGDGWVYRAEPLALGFGHYLLVRSWGEHLRQIGGPLALVTGTALGLIALLLSMARYWNRRFLTRTHAEAARVLEGELINHLLVHVTPVGLCIVRARDFEIVVANRIARTVLGLSDTATHLPERLRASFEARRMAMLRAAPQVFQCVFSPGDQEGTHGTNGTHGASGEHLEITCSPAVLNREDVLFCAIADMSTHYEAAQTLREARQTSEAAARAKVSFFAAMSHEIRTPLASLVGNIELLGTAPLSAEQAARVRSMQASASGLLQIVNDVLDFSKMDVGEMRLVTEWGSITDLLERIVIAHAPLAVRQGLQYYVVLDRAIPSRLRFDPVRVAQIINNLLGNAFKFTHSGKIVVEARWIDERLEIVVTDSGAGIPQELQGKLFQPFTQGEGQRLTQTGSTGLGLSICARLCELMHGRVALESAVGVGTRITVELPLAIAPNSSASGDAWTLPVPPDASATILCRASEYRAWLANLFDATASVRILSGTPDDPDQAGASSLSNLSSLPGSPRPLSLPDSPGSAASASTPQRERDYLLVTDEFTLQKVLCLWGSSHNVIWVRQDGPLVPIRRDDGSIEVTIYSPASILAAVGQLDRPSSFMTRAQDDSADFTGLDERQDRAGAAAAPLTATAAPFTASAAATASPAPSATPPAAHPATPEDARPAAKKALAPAQAARAPENAWRDAHSTHNATAHTTRAAHTTTHNATRTTHNTTTHAAHSTRMAASIPAIAAISAMRARHSAHPAPHILIAEDNLLNRELLRDQLRTLGASVTEAGDGKEALALLLDAAHAIDAVLTDVDMPTMNGFELLDAIRPAHPGLPVYAISASARPEDIAHGRARGFTDYLSKPVPLAVLADVLTQTSATAANGADSANDMDDVDDMDDADNANDEGGQVIPPAITEIMETTMALTPAFPPDLNLDPDSLDDLDDDDAQASMPRFPLLQNAWRQTFVTQCGQDLAALDPIVNARDLTQLGRWAHRVAGGLAVLGPSMLHEFCEELRACIREASGWNNEIGELARAFGEELADMQQAAKHASEDHADDRDARADHAEETSINVNA